MSLGLGRRLAGRGLITVAALAAAGCAAAAPAPLAGLTVARGVVSKEPAASPRPTDALGPSSLVTFDRPYLLLVTDSRTGEPLFLARVADPATS